MYGLPYNRRGVHRDFSRPVRVAHALDNTPVMNAMHGTLSSGAPVSSSRVATVVGLWAAAGLTFGASGALAQLPRPMVPLLIWSPVVAAVVAYRRVASVRALVASLDPRALVLLHVLRVYFGAHFLLEAAAGRLSERFAHIAGPGDIAVGVLALPLALLAARPTTTARTLTLAWNTLGLADMLLVFATAQRLLFIERDVAFLRAFGRLPYAALPTFVVPLVITAHLALFARLRRAHATP